MTVTRPHVLLSAAMSIDGYLDAADGPRLILSSPEDLADVRRTRGRYGAILVGAQTVRRDDPALLAVDGPDPVKIVVTADGRLDPAARFFTEGTADKIVWCDMRSAQDTAHRLKDVARVQALAGFDSLPVALEALAGQGIERLMVEGGSRILTEFLTRGLVDELRLAVAPLFVGAAQAPRLVQPGRFPHDAAHRMTLHDTRRLGDMVVSHYRLGE